MFLFQRACFASWAAVGPTIGELGKHKTSPGQILREWKETSNMHKEPTNCSLFGWLKFYVGVLLYYFLILICFISLQAFLLYKHYMTMSARHSGAIQRMDCAKAFSLDGSADIN